MRLLLVFFLSLICSLPATAGRVLPLNRFPASRQSEKAGYFRMATGIGDDYFDGASPASRVRRHFQFARKLGVQYLRCAFSWNAIEKAPGHYDWSFWDDLVNEAQRAHIQLIPYVAYTPEWAATSRQQFWSQPPRNADLYSRFMYQIVSRYRGKIASWEIWNEPDNQDYWRGSVEQFADLATKAAVEMRRADPSVVLVLGGMSHGPSKFFRDLLMDYHLGDYIDVFAMHGYPESWQEERAETVYHGWVQQMSELVQRYAPGSDVWINEMGYADYRYAAAQASKYGISVFYDYEHTRAYQAAFLFKDYVMALASGRISLAGWYRIDDFPASAGFSKDAVDYHLGVVDVSGAPKPAFYALQFFDRLFSRPAKLVSSTLAQAGESQADVDVFQGEDGKVIVAAWLRSSLPSEVSAKTGVLHDTRAETVSAPIPCFRIAQLDTYTPEGQKARGTAQFTPGRLQNVHVSGDTVFIAVLSCRN